MLHEFNRITGLADSTLLVLRPIHWHFFSIKSTDQLPGRLGFEKVLLRCPIYATVSKVLNHLILIVLASSCTSGCILSHWIFFLVGHPGSTFTFLKSSIVRSVPTSTSAHSRTTRTNISSHQVMSCTVAILPDRSCQIC